MTAWKLFSATVLSFTLALGGSIAYVVQCLHPGRLSPQSIQEVAMPGGSVLVLERVLTGKEQRNDICRNPETFFEWFRGKPIVLNSGIVRLQDENLPTLHLTCRMPPRGEFVPFDWYSHCVVVDDDGREFRELNGSGNCAYKIESTGRQVHLFSSHCAPIPLIRHRGDTVKVRVYDTRDQVVAELDVPHPGGAAQPVWTPAPVPTSQSDGEVELTLKSLTSEADEIGCSNGVIEYSRHDLDIEVRESRPGLVSRRKYLLRGFDALGNSFGPIAQWFPGKGEDKESGWYALSADEASWKLEFTLLAGPAVTLDGLEQATCSEVQIPAPETPMALGKSLTFGGATLEILAAGGRGVTVHRLSDSQAGDGAGPNSPNGELAGCRFSITSEFQNSNTVVTVDSSFPHVVALTHNFPPDRELLLRAVDDHGRNVPCERAHAAGLHFWFLQTEPDGRSVNLTFAFHQPRRFTVFVPSCARAIPELRMKPPDVIAEEPADSTSRK